MGWCVFIGDCIGRFGWHRSQPNAMVPHQAFMKEFHIRYYNRDFRAEHKAGRTPHMLYRQLAIEQPMRLQPGQVTGPFYGYDFDKKKVCVCLALWSLLQESVTDSIFEWTNERTNEKYFRCRRWPSTRTTTSRCTHTSRTNIFSSQKIVREWTKSEGSKKEEPSMENIWTVSSNSKRLPSSRYRNRRAKERNGSFHDRQIHQKNI